VNNLRSICMNRTRWSILHGIGIAFLMTAAGAGGGTSARAQAPDGGAVQAVFPDAQRAPDEAARRRAQEDARAEAALKQRLSQMEKTLEQLERRMGRATQTPTTFNTVEKRMEDLQRRLDRLERDWNQRLRKLEDQVQRLERRGGPGR
jgi:septal ring factor EnvC (AmiA/AmiB activator)